MGNPTFRKGNSSSDSRRKFIEKLGFGTMMAGTAGRDFASGNGLAEQVNPVKNTIWDPYNYGAKGDSKTVDTKAIQVAIDSCHASGGGKVVLHNGNFVSGTIILKSNVSLHVESGATLLGSTDLKDYPDITPKILYLYTKRFTRYLIYAESAENISITGTGTINGNGRVSPFVTYVTADDKGRPYILRFAECKNVMVRDITFRDSARWLQHYLACENVTIDGITVINRTRENRDGIDIDSCNRVRIANCYIDSGDDGLTLKATAMRSCKNVTVTNCVLTSTRSTIKLGTESNGGFENILITNCTVSSGDGEFTVADAIALEMVDGAVFDRVTISNIVINNVQNAIFIRLGNRANTIPGLEKPGIGSMSNIIIDNIQATEVSNLGCSITGLPEKPIENVSLSNIRIQFKGGGTAKDASIKVKELSGSYPSSMMYGKLPVYGFFCRHISNLNFHNINIGFENEELRPALCCENINSLTIEDFNAKISPEANAYFVFKNVKDAMIRGCRPSGINRVFLHATGNGSENISLYHNDLSKAQQAVEAEDLIKDRIIVGENTGLSKLKG